MNTTSIPCPCGSGLRQQVCCALDLATLSPPQSSEFLLPLVERARQAFRNGLADTAERLSLNVLDLAPGEPGALDTLRRVRGAQGRHGAEEVLLRRFVTLYPNEIEQTRDLALLLLQQGELVEAERHARNAVRGAPMDVQAHNVLAMVFTEAHQPHLGEIHYRRALELSGERAPILLANLAWALAGQGKVEEARALYAESTAAAPAVLQTWLGWARLEEADRQLDRAAELLDRAEAVAPGHRGIRLVRATVLGRKRDHAAAVATLEESAATAPLDVNDWLEKGRQLDLMGRPEAAFAAWQEGKRLARHLNGAGYQAAEAQALAARLRGFFTAKRLQITPRAAPLPDSPQPIFILGFPRSGTTLVEQSLSVHANITGCGELPFVSVAAQGLPRLLNVPFTYPDALAELWIADHRDGMDRLRDEYMRGVRQLGLLAPGAAWFTDKMPLNETHLGFIALMFPQAPLIHVLRHPLDVVVSVFSHNLTHGFNCALELEGIARHYVLVTELVEHYRAEMALRYLPVRHEQMLADQEGTLRDILAFIGEPYDPRCLRFDENTRHARTASYAQVTEKLNARSQNRYRRYLPQLEPVIALLEPTIRRLGYTIEG